MKFRRKYYVRIGSTECRNKLGSTDFSICSNIRWILYVIHAPAEKEQKRIQEMIAEMEVGDTVLTTSGFYGVIIDITDDDYGIWYMDAADDKDRYEGKTVRFTARIMKNRKLPKNFCVPGRKAMTCCAEDIRFIGFFV